MKLIGVALALILPGVTCQTLEKCTEALKDCQAPCKPAISHGACYCACPEPTPSPSPSPSANPTPPPCPEPTPSPTSEPTPTPTPWPEPTPTPGPVCHLAPMPDCSEDGCCQLTTDEGTFGNAIAVSQAMVIVRYPARFARDNKGTYLVNGAADEDWYMAELARTIHERSPSLCAQADEDEIAIKESNALSEEYDVLTSKFYVRPPHKTAECRPSWW